MGWQTLQNENLAGLDSVRPGVPGTVEIVESNLEFFAEKYDWPAGTLATLLEDSDDLAGQVDDWTVSEWSAALVTPALWAAVQAEDSQQEVTAYLSGMALLTAPLPGGDKVSSYLYQAAKTSNGLAATSVSLSDVSTQIKALTDDPLGAFKREADKVPTTTTDNGVPLWVPALAVVAVAVLLSR